MTAYPGGCLTAARVMGGCPPSDLTGFQDGHAAAVMGGKIYVTGGSNQVGSANSVCVYDPQANAWTQLASMGAARRLHASAAVGGKLYVFGGNDGYRRLSTAEIYDPASGSWAQGPSLTSARESAVAVSC